VINKNLIILSAWKPIHAKAQAIDTVLRQWEVMIRELEQWLTVDNYKAIITAEKVDLLKKQADKMLSIATNQPISWKHDKNIKTISSLTTNLSNLSQSFSTMRANIDRIDKIKDPIDNFLDDIAACRTHLTGIYEFWDDAIKLIVTGTFASVKDFDKNLGTKIFKSIKTTYPTKKWDDISKDVLDAISKVELPEKTTSESKSSSSNNNSENN
jgi:hypothetical protein